jgi:hypothetical protein
MDERPTYRPDQTGPEPEIIPPDRPDRGRYGATDRGRDRGESRIWVSLGQNRFDRVYIARPGPFAMILAALVLGLAGLAVVVVLLGAVLLWLPITVLVVAGLVLSSVLRGYFRRQG